MSDRLSDKTINALPVPATGNRIQYDSAVKGFGVRVTAKGGDTIKCDGVNMRDMGDGAPFVSGYDTPEIQHKKCAAELALGQKAKSRMAALLKSPGIGIFDSGQVDATQSHRPLVWIILADGRSVGSVLMAEGLARRWSPDYEADWCGSSA